MREQIRHSSVGFRRSVPTARLGGCFDIQDVLGLRSHTLLFGLARAICRHPAARSSGDVWKSELELACEKHARNRRSKDVWRMLVETD